MIDGTIGMRLRRLRAERGCSLSELSRRSGIGKGTISELENDRRGARLDTLFALVTALDAPLGALLSDGAVSEDAASADAAAGGVAVQGDSVAAVLLARWSLADQLVEVYRATLAVTQQRWSPHAAGVEETVTVVRGRVRVGCLGQQRDLGAGESLRYRADRPHFFEACGGPAEVLLLMHYPRQEDTKGIVQNDR